MRIDAHTAAIDNDFINHLVETKFDDEKLVAVLSIVFSELNLSAIMHPLVYEKELLKDNARIKLLFGSNVVSNVSFDDILQNDAARKDYYIYCAATRSGQNQRRGIIKPGQALCPGRS